MTHSIAVIALLAASLALASCGKEAAETPAAPPVSDAPTAPATPDDDAPAYEAVGKVVNIIASRKFVVIDHEAIPGFMDAMSMPFEVKDTTVLAGIQPGDSVRFTFTVAGGVQVMEKIE